MRTVARRRLLSVAMSSLASIVLCAVVIQGEMSENVARSEARKGYSSNAGTITFSVGNCPVEQRLTGVQVFLATREEGLLEMGETDSVGQLMVSEDILARPDAMALLFCKKGFFCGAFRLGSPSFFTNKYQLVNLAPFSIK